MYKSVVHELWECDVFKEAITRELSHNDSTCHSHLTIVRHCITQYSGTSLIRTPLGQKKVSLLVRCPDFRGCNVHKQGVWDSQRCPVYQGVLISGVS